MPEAVVIYGQKQCTVEVPPGSLLGDAIAKTYLPWNSPARPGGIGPLWQIRNQWLERSWDRVSNANIVQVTPEQRKGISAFHEIPNEKCHRYFRQQFQFSP
jgi:hypothetical protein